MNEATEMPTETESAASGTPGEGSPRISAAAKARQLSRTANERSLQERRAAVREQALREKARRAKSGSGKVTPASAPVSAGGALANLSDASWDEIKDQLDVLHGEAEDYIRENPTKAVLAAAGVGFVLGILMKR